MDWVAFSLLLFFIIIGAVAFLLIRRTNKKQSSLQQLQQLEEPAAPGSSFSSVSDSSKALNYDPSTGGYHVKMPEPLYHAPPGSMTGSTVSLALQRPDRVAAAGSDVRSKLFDESDSVVSQVENVDLEAQHQQQQQRWQQKQRPKSSSSRLSGRKISG